MTEADTSHPALLAVARGTSTVALIVMVIAVGILILRLFPVFQSLGCPMGTIGSPPPQSSPPGGMSCVADFSQSQPMPGVSEQLSAAVKPVVENAIPIAAFLGTAIVRSGIGQLCPSHRQRAEQTEGNA